MGESDPRVLARAVLVNVARTSKVHRRLDAALRVVSVLTQHADGAGAAAAVCTSLQLERASPGGAPALIGARLTVHSLHLLAATAQAGALRVLHAVAAAGPVPPAGRPPEGCDAAAKSVFLGPDARLTDAQAQSMVAELQADLQTLNLTAADTAFFWSLLAAIVYLGVVRFTSNQEGHTVVASPQALAHVGRLLSVPVAELTTVLTRQTIPGTDSEFIERSVPQAEAVRNELAQTLYGQLVAWLVQHANSTLAAPDADHAAVHVVCLPAVTRHGLGNAGALHANLLTELVSWLMMPITPTNQEDKEKEEEEEK